LDFSNALELLVATILAAQCTDKRINIVTVPLFKRCPTAKDYAEISQAELEGLIKSSGFYHAKATNIRAAAAMMVERFGGEVPRRMEDLVQLPGVGRKTANVVLGNAFGQNVGIVVDTHVTRLAHRLGLTQQKDPEKIEKELMELIPAKHWTMFSHWLIFHGRRRCLARTPDCAGCEIRSLCPTGLGELPPYEKKKSTASRSRKEAPAKARK
jgi:endonuclease-3